MRKISLTILIILMSLVSCVQDVTDVNDITIEDLKTVIEKEKKIQLLDVRLSSESKKGMILNAVQVNLISNNFQSEVTNTLDIDKPVYVYCHSGTRSKIACKLLKDKGYNVFNIKGGYKGWLDSK